MKTPDQKAALEAVARLSQLQILDLQVSVAHLAIKALICAHPEPEKVRTYYDQLLGQIMTGPGVLGHPDKALVLRDLTATLFAPPASLDT